MGQGRVWHHGVVIFMAEDDNIGCAALVRDKGEFGSEWHDGIFIADRLYSKEVYQLSLLCMDSPVIRAIFVNLFFQPRPPGLKFHPYPFRLLVITCIGIRCWGIFSSRPNTTIRTCRATKEEIHYSIC
jgi:hypothetical protein